MLKQNKLNILITSLITLVPMFVGCILWNKLPDSIAIHFGLDNEANGWSSKPVAVFVIPIVMVALHLICLAVTSVDPKYKNIGKKPIEIAFWIIPVISLVMCVVVYGSALDVNIDIGFICNLLMGVLLIILGNVMPKVKQNYSFGIKNPWTLDDADNWNRSNRLGGWCMVIAGVIITISSCWYSMWITITMIILTILVPTIYSYLLYCKKNREGMK